MNRERPAGELIVRFSIGGIDEKLEGLAMIGLRDEVDRDEAEPAPFLDRKSVV